MLLLVSAAVNLASNDGEASVCVVSAGALVTIGKAPELAPSHCWLAAEHGTSDTAAVASAAIVT
jgi:hypothetical protein